ncbi:conjugal transfer protein TrbI [Sphingobium sp. GW456-12-10-14-TSB1]|uniref:type IV secretion system protein VirB10 n=1 Tax=Sphingobium TaxID=165695 RepID=UPI0002FB0A82|nr:MULTISPECIES: type IV secretion system protein VirB10 [Sphingobium]OAN57427.1 conjugal transfer protein TrbI [Sphingobium sp. TCM1]OUC55885.1 conjugal transfer protein TrbI [Sphingobium sp. GW456-12-10-14-TSB1]
MDEPAPEAPRRPAGDPTPERDEIIRERGIDPIGGMTPAKRNTALIFAGTAMVLGILWVNSGPSTSSKRNLMDKPEAMARRPDLAARETVAYDAVAAKPKPLGAPSADPNAPVINPAPGTVGPDGQIVPALQPGAAPAAAAQDKGQNLADQARRSTLIAYGGREALQGGGRTAGGGADGSQADDAGDGAEGRVRGNAPNALDALRQSSAVGEARASMLPNRNYLVTAGTLIPCILQTAMNSAQPGYTSCLIPRDIYSENGRVVLMEKGTKVLGEYHGGIQQGQNRLFVLWTRAVTPQGVRIDLASPGSDALGRAGIAGSVDTFFWARFGSALLLSLVDDAAYIAGQAVSSGNNNFNNTTRTPSEGAGIALQNSINIRPVLTKNQGEEVGIFVAKDFNFADVYGLELRREK